MAVLEFVDVLVVWCWYVEAVAEEEVFVVPAAAATVVVGAVTIIVELS